ncbi:uncharacterized protein KY384_003313 [Bacidia gigantensis]|uniref:uncharacterized protein n=1 Tax=Bacidia gigantensis TaxID=2732470 RepID=UPI001D0476C4|nr:uncharacterized protein KY384_003313 [Bacidia gigantensis]KAG8531681.1 hypothetical protein KY384_003313 [Bacidia gigantensis]
MRSVSRRFRHIIDHIIYERLLAAALLDDWRLIIECYHPWDQRSADYVFCEYLETPSLSLDARRSGMNGIQTDSFKNLHARFRPCKTTPELSYRRRQPPGDIPGSRTSDAANSAGLSGEDSVKLRINLDSHENFSQLIFSSSLVRIGPRKGVFYSLANVLDRKTMRLFRSWLSQKADLDKPTRGPEEELPDATRLKVDQAKASQLIWIDDGTKIAGLDIELKELKWNRTAPILMDRDEERNISYSIELKGMLI